MDSTSNLTALKDAINSVSGATGISASLTDLSGINLVQQEGYDIVIGDVTTSHASGTMTIKVADKSGTAQGTEQTLKGFTTADDSVAMVGQVSLSSHKAFTVKSGDAANHFATDTSAQTSTLQSMGAIDISSQTGATKALSVIDGDCHDIGSPL